MADQVGSTIGSGVGAVGGSLFGPLGTAAGGVIGGAIGSLFNGNETPTNNGAGQYAGMASQDLQESTANQNFWNGVYAQFNPQETAVTSTPSAPAYQNIANNAKSMFNNNPNGGPTGNVDQNAVGQNLTNKANQASTTQDINNFLKDTSQNQQTAEQREMSMFSGSQNQNSENKNFVQNAPEQAALEAAKTGTQEGNDWNTYQNNQPNMLNEVGAAAGGASGKILGGQASTSLFGNKGNAPAADEEGDEDVTDVFGFND